MNSSIGADNKRAYLELMERMLLIRTSEERLGRLAKNGELPGAVHLYIGQEACAVGACSVLDDRDWITSTHRGHGHFLAKGGELRTMFAEIWGKREGICKGMGGSMHVADFSKGILGANGIVGGGFGIATGAAFGAKLRGDGRVSACFFGDGAANQGTFMESMNISSAWELPLVLFCENNGLSEFTVSRTVTGGQLVDRAKAFMPTEVVDGNDVLAVQAAMIKAVERARRGQGPSYVEAKTYRIRGHLEAEDAMLGGGTYRTKDQIAEWQTPERDPISRFGDYLREAGIADAGEIDGLRSQVSRMVEDAVAYANAGTDADVGLAHSLMFADQEA
ncbi:thiamine pyrophosphate-dependent dehydrogenase E1 component subunit alpha [Bradyrhizobium diazoefficiens]|uniref:thiamine pyrophosphate-dependent dehydrogenase E1 component subunit alpha n=1 Tax=Bradyrhizobium diazoefficiens TaxID=1355477 RepID=UPI001B8BC812|nr:thiamine pyrophosphate-dependent dehydrogenase E1 component subunit alpha [Bradyrhizobium diazoefficiens]MBR0863505.1 thiamine pyrophosphate-dependent dehydrogenase E1 component subunit alpha [Bradyrhizobium diazoefficiens]MBR0888190.1 thiamine pyrophosphate-dependent dehydrogenase E1 component subunit alpha [Bradyrhizobium diazoefficiens]MBR0919831.1 thiamine pyrophosphate-dependent dehydrogenase E1 component subunit alpha [Bradyrhizobium diazoefficiens]